MKYFKIILISLTLSISFSNKGTAQKNFDFTKWDSLLKAYVSENGEVNYKDLKNEWNTLKDIITSLSKETPNKNWNKNQKLAYWINAYNILTIDLILRNYPIKSIKDINTPWKQSLWKLADKLYNLNEIEHQILRKMNEPRIHFAIVCASYSCPKLLNKAYTSENLEEQLTEATKGFVNDSERNSISDNNLDLSKIFKWFSKDFEQNSSLIDFLNLYSDVQISENAKTNFKEYNWNLNE